MIDPRPSIQIAKPTVTAAGGGIHDDWRLIRDAKSIQGAVASRQALTPPVRRCLGIHEGDGGWGHTRAGGFSRPAKPIALATRLLPS